MSDELIPVPQQLVPAGESEQTVFLQGETDLCLVARYPYQMQRCQDALKDWAVRKVAEVTAEHDDLVENIAIAKKAGWGRSALVRAERKALKRLQFYQKIKLAVEAGYCIVPNFPVQMFAIRTKRRYVERNETHGWAGQEHYQQSAQQLAAGEGEYKNPTPIIFNRQIKDGENSWRQHWAEDWNELEFPFATAKPQILKATERAMADKIFDELGVLPGQRRNEDPIVVGRILDPRNQKYNPTFVTFLIAWYLETKTL